MTRKLIRWPIMLLILLACFRPVQAQTPVPPGPEDLVVISPASDAVVGGVVSILGTVQVEALRGYTLAFGPGPEPTQWIPIGELRSEPIENGRLAFWDTTQIPDGLYTLRLRAVYGDGALDYRDVYVDNLLVSNAPQSPTPMPTSPPTATPTATLTPSPTVTPGPTLALEDGVSPFVYLKQMDQYDPLCEGWDQRYSIWVSNVGMITVTNVIITDSLPLGFTPVLEESTEGVQQVDESTVTWAIEELAPGDARKLELQVDVASWVEVGGYVTNQVTLASDQVEQLSSAEQSLVSACPWVEQTATARPIPLPTSLPSATPTTPSEASGRPTLLPTGTPIAIAISDETISSSLDTMTLLIAVGLGVLLVVTMVLFYRKVARRR